MKKRIAIIGLICIMLVAAAAFAAWQMQTGTADSDNSINSFEECTSAGNPVQESYPSVCRTPDGKTFENPEERQRMNAQQAAVEQARAYEPVGMCTAVLVPAVHIESGATFTFPGGCIAPGWEPVR